MERGYAPGGGPHPAANQPAVPQSGTWTATDVQDAEVLVDLLRHVLLNPSFVPLVPVVRDLWERTQEVNHGGSPQYLSGHAFGATRLHGLVDASRGSLAQANRRYFHRK